MSLQSKMYYHRFYQLEYKKAKNRLLIAEREDGLTTAEIKKDFSWIEFYKQMYEYYLEDLLCQVPECLLTELLTQ